jgi:HAE1 family hydrophobic/amphiphilic exporter-1
LQRSAQDDPDVLSKLYTSSAAGGKLVALNTRAPRSSAKPQVLSVNHQGQLPSVTDLVQPRARRDAVAGASTASTRAMEQS